MPGEQSDKERDPLSTAHAERTKQLYEARGALAEAVSTLRSQLSECRGDLERATDENRELREYTEALRAEIHELEEAVRAADRRTDAVLNIRIVRWTARPRGMLYRLRSRYR